MVVISVHDAQEYASAMGSKDQLIVIDFTASWCGPCKVMAPIFDKLSGQFPTAKFLKIDVDEHQEIAQKHGIQAMPTFHLYKNGQRLEELRGANAAQLELLIKKHAASATGGSSAGPAYIPTGFTDLSEFVHKNQIECLNEKTGTARNVFSKGGAELESDCDEQLILVVPFTQAVKLHSIKFISKRGDPLKKAPKTVKLYLNRTHLSFDEAEKEEPTQVLQLTAKDYEDDQSATALRFVKFQNVNSIAIFLQDNLGGGDVTALEQLVFIGQPLQQTRDISELKKDPNAAEMALWVDKYRPNDLKELDYHDPLSQTLETLANSADMPHLLVYGPSGAGKKTRIHALLKAIYGPGAAKLALTTKTFQTPSGTKLEIQVMSSHFHMELTPSDVGNQDRVVVQEVIKEMAQAPQMATSGTAMEQQPAGHARQFKVVVLHQADMLSKDAQHGLRRTMEKYMNNMRLILCCESTSRILAPIRSRCLLVRVPAPRPEEMVQVMKRVSRQEGIQFDDAVLQRVAETSHRDMRRALLMLEASYVQNPNVIKNPDLVITEADWELFIKQLAHDVLQEQSPARLAAVRSKLYELLAHCIPAETILKHLTLNLLHRVDDGLKPVLIQQAAIYEHKLRLGNKQIYHLEAFVAKWMSVYKNYLLELAA